MRRALFWLTHEAAGLGVDASNEGFRLNRLDPVGCYLELDGEQILAVPAFDAPATGPGGLIGNLSLSDHEDGFSSPGCRPDRFIRGNTTGCAATPLIAPIKVGAGKPPLGRDKHQDIPKRLPGHCAPFDVTR